MGNNKSPKKKHCNTNQSLTTTSTSEGTASKRTRRILGYEFITQLFQFQYWIDTASKLFFTLSTLSTSLGLIFLLEVMRMSSHKPQLVRTLPANMSIPMHELALFDNGSFTMNYDILNKCIKRLICPPEFHACSNRDPQQLGFVFHFWSCFLLLGWGFYLCHHFMTMGAVFDKTKTTEKSCKKCD